MSKFLAIKIRFLEVKRTSFQVELMRIQEVIIKNKVENDNLELLSGSLLEVSVKFNLRNFKYT